MKSQRLNKDMRNAIVKLSLEKAFSEDYEKLKKMEKELNVLEKKLLDEAYDTAFEPKHIRIMKEAPDNFYPKVSSAIVNLEKEDGTSEIITVEWSRVLTYPSSESKKYDAERYGDYKRVPYVCTSYRKNRPFKTITYKHKYMVLRNKFEKLEDEYLSLDKDIHEKSRELSQNIWAIVNSYNTTNTLRQAWPEVEEILEGCIVDNENVQSLLPAVRLEDINKKLGIGKFKK